MKKILSILFAIILLLTVVITSVIVASAEDVYCYMAAAGSINVLDGMKYTSETYATAEDALNAAFEDFASVIGGRGDRRICLAKDITLTTPLAPKPSVKKASYLELNGHTITYAPTSEHVNTSAITIDNNYISKFIVYSSKSVNADSPYTFVNGGNANFFSTGLTGDAFAFSGSFKSDFNINELYVSGATTIYGNVTAKSLKCNVSLTVNGNVTTDAFWAGDATVTVNGD